MRADSVGVELIVKLHSLLQSLNRRFSSSPSSRRKQKDHTLQVVGCILYAPPILLNLLLLHERLHSMCVCNHTHLHLKPSKACSSPVFRAQNDLVSTQCNMCVSASGGSRYQTRTHTLKRAHTQPWHDKQKAMKAHEQKMKLHPSVFICMKRISATAFGSAHLNSVLLLFRCCLFHTCHARHHFFNTHGAGALIVNDPSITA